MMATLDLGSISQDLDYYVKQILGNSIDNLIESYIGVANIATRDKHILDSFAEWIKSNLECEVQNGT